MSDMLPQSTRIVEAPLPALPAIECQTLSAFLRAIRLERAHIAILKRQITPRDADGVWEVHFAVHLSGRSVDLGCPVCYATFFATIVRGKSTAGELIFPYQSAHQQGDLATEANRLVTELRHCLVQVLGKHPAVMGICLDERYPLPDSYVWGVQSDASAEGIRFQDGHWVLHSPSGNAPRP